MAVSWHSPNPDGSVGPVLPFDEAFSGALFLVSTQDETDGSLGVPQRVPACSTCMAHATTQG